MSTRDVMVGDTRFEIRTTREGQQWRAAAYRSGERFGVEPSAPIEAEAVERLTDWLKWQHRHGQALATLQQAEQAYHRALAGQAFADQRHVEAMRQPNELLAAVEAARAELDVVRARRPEV